MLRIGGAWRAIVIVALAIACAVSLVAPALYYRGFLDENATVETAVNFLTQLQFAILPGQRNFGAFEPEMSIGLVSSLPAGVGWLLGGNLLAARLTVAAYCLALACVVAYIFVRRHTPQLRADTLPLALLCAWTAFTVVPGVPHVVVVTMGEFSAAAILALGWLLLPASPPLGAFVLGLCVWHTKFIYAPFALLALVADGVRRAPWRRNAARLFAIEFGAFFLSLAAWVLLVWLRTGYWGLLEWLTRRGRFFGFGHYSDLDVASLTAGLSARLASPDLEWSHYGTMVRLKIIALLAVPVVVLLAQIVRRWRSEPRRWDVDLVQLGLCVSLLAGGYWYFFRHTFMWLRHVMPFLLVGFGVLLFFALGRAARLSPTRRAWIAAAVAVLLAMDGLLEWHAMHVSIATMPAARMFPLRCEARGRPTQGPWKRNICWEQYQRPLGQPVDLSPGELRP